jgi:hypothetical protein
VKIFHIALKKIVFRLSRVRSVRSAIVERADLSAFRRRPGPKVVCGLAVIAFSYVIGWPLIAVLGILSVHYHDAAIVAVGGPVAYGVSHLVFLLGMYVAGAKYSRIFLRWAVCQGMTRLMARYRLPLPAPALADVPVVASHDEQGGYRRADPSLPVGAFDCHRARRQNEYHGEG